MKRRGAGALLLLALSLALSGAAFSEQDGRNGRGERVELWTGALYTSTYRAGICISAGGGLRGTLYLRRADGVVDRYTVSGTVSGDRITARHHSGHEFSGRFSSADAALGELRLKNGYTLTVRAKRSPNPEVDESCRLIGQE